MSVALQIKHRRMDMRRWSCAIMLALYALVQTPILPLAMLMMAEVDGDHRIEISADGGRLSIALRHDQKAVAHHHTALIQWFAGADTKAKHPDHVVEFDAIADAIQESAAKLTSGVALVLPVLEVALTQLMHSVGVETPLPIERVLLPPAMLRELGTVVILV